MKCCITACCVLLAAGLAFGRGESWMPPPPVPPAVATLTNEQRYVEWKWREDVTDPATGLGLEALTNKVTALRRELEAKEDWRVVKARCYQLVCNEMSIDVSPLDWNPSIAVWNRYRLPLDYFKHGRQGPISQKFYSAAKRRLDEGNASGKWRMWVDFDHSVPVWEELIADGFTGVLANVEKSDDGGAFYESLRITAEASLRLIGRLAELGRKKAERIGEGGGEGEGRKRIARLRKQVAALEQLTKGPPRTAYEVMLFIDLYFFLCEHLDMMQCRCLTVIDRTLWPFYRADLAAGRTTETEFREQFRHFLWQWGSVDNYWGQPITVGGTRQDGTTEYNPLSHVILDVMDECYLPTPKFHAKVGKSTPRPILDKLLDMARRHRSLTFIGEEAAWRVLESCGYSSDEVRGFYTRGCYEICVPNGANGTGVGYLNLLQPVELVLKDAAAGRFDGRTYEDFVAEVCRREARVAREAMDCALDFEKHLDDVNPANVSTLGVRHAIRVGKDAFSTGSERGNNTSILTTGLGTTADALVAVKELVYEKRQMTLAELGRLMAKNWEGAEDLRQRMLRSVRKYGNNDKDANAAAVRIQDALAAEVNGKPNARGGRFLLSGHCARAFLYLGEQTGATPDGRKAGAEMSKNLSATMGSDTEGVTALVATLGSLDSRKWPGDFPLDVMLHPSSADGEKGLELMRTLLDVYFANGGVQIQFVVVSPEELRDAQKHPEKYENLQVRVCGWNVRWNDIPKSEQDAYILRAERIMR